MDYTELIAYLVPLLRQGIPVDALRVTLKGAGWQDGDIDAALEKARAQMGLIVPTAQGVVIEAAQTVEPQSQSQTQPQQKPPSEYLQPQSGYGVRSFAMDSKRLGVQSPAPVEVEVLEHKQPSHLTSVLKWVIISVVIIAIGIGGVFAYQNGLIPFLNSAPYSREEVLTKGLAKFSDITSASYSLSGLFEVQPRDLDAVAYKYDESKLDSIRPAYRRDKMRIDVLSTIRGKVLSRKTYPKTFNELVSVPNDVSSSLVYAQTRGGSGYELSVTFETSDAVDAISTQLNQSNYPYSFSQPQSSSQNITARVQGKTITFSEGTQIPYYVSFSGQPPKPVIANVLEGASTLVSSIPNDTRVKITASGSSQLQNSDAQNSDKKLGIDFSLAADVNLGDLSMMFDVDAKIIDKTFYFRINKFPGMFFVNPTAIRGKWVKVDEKDTASLMNIKANEQNKKQEEVIANSKKVAQIALEEKLFTVTDGPIRSDIGDTKAYKYSLGVNRDSVVKFIKRFVNEILKKESQDASLTQAQKQNNEKLIQVYDDFVVFLEKSDYNEVFEYIRKNMSYDVWFSRRGFPVKYEQKTRFVPIGDSPKTNGLQFVVTITGMMDKINEKISVQAPTEFISSQKAQELVFGGASGPLGVAREKGKDASIKANISSMRASAEIYYDNHKNSYGPALGEGSCSLDSRIRQSMFGSDKLISSAIKSIQSSGSTSTYCAASSKSYAIAAALVSDNSGYSCADSTGAMREVLSSSTDNIILGSGTQSDPYRCGF